MSVTRSIEIYENERLWVRVFYPPREVHTPHTMGHSIIRDAVFWSQHFPPDFLPEQQPTTSTNMRLI